MVSSASGPASRAVIATNSATPIRVKPHTGSSTQPGTYTITKEITSRALRAQLAGTMFPNIPRLHEKVFPTSRMQASIEFSMEALKSGADPLYSNRQWTGWDQLPNHTDPLRDEAVCTIFNRIVAVVAQSFNSLQKEESSYLRPRQWTAAFANSPHGNTAHPTTEACQRKPDGVLLPVGLDIKDARTSKLDSFLEIKSTQNATGLSSSQNQLAENVRLAFSSQDDRCFVLGLTLVQSNLRLWLFDHSGVLQSELIDIHQRPEDFVHILCGFAFGSRSTLGYDSTMATDKDGRRWINFCDEPYEILETLYIDDVIRGRGTVVLRVRAKDSTENNILKSSWIDILRPEKEYDLLAKAEHVHGIAHMIKHDVVKVDGIIDSTQIIRDELGLKYAKGKKPVEIRQHHRLLLRECGLSLSKFATRRELLSIFVDAIKGTFSHLYSIKMSSLIQPQSSQGHV
jgi:hypothetical protein